MREGQRRELLDLLHVESIRLPRRLMQAVRRFAQANGLGISESYRRLVAQGLALPPPSKQAG